MLNVVIENKAMSIIQTRARAEGYAKEDVQFGFEYETLVEPTEEYWNLVEKTVIAINNGLLDKQCPDEQGKGVFSKIKESNKNMLKNMTENEMLSIYKEYADVDVLIDEWAMNVDENKDISARTDVHIQLADQNIPGDDHSVQRFLLAAIFNYVLAKANMNRYFKFNAAANKTGNALCDTFVIIDKQPGIQATNNTGTRNIKTWSVTYDGSVERNEEPIYRYFGSRTKHSSIAYIKYVEIVSPILSYTDVDKNIKSIINDVLTANGMFTYWNNTLTSNHIHLSHKKLSFGDNPLALVKLCMAWWYVEPLVLLMMGHWRRDNHYCVPLAKRVQAPFNNERAFMTLSDMNIIDEIPKILPAFTRENLLSNKELLMLTIAFIFQGDLYNRNTRYSALNLLNLVPDGIQTAEVRIKHGSGDGEESRMFMLLLADFLSAAISKPCITMLDDANKQNFWNVGLMLTSNVNWTKTNRLYVSRSEKKAIQQAFDVFMNIIEPAEGVKEYWTKRFNYILSGGKLTSTDDNSRASQSPQEGGKGKMPIKYRNGELTSFGYVDYEKLRKSIGANPNYQFIKEAFKSGSKRLARASVRSKSVKSPRLPTEMMSRMSLIEKTKLAMPMAVSAAAGGNAEKEKKGKKKSTTRT